MKSLIRCRFPGQPLPKT